MDHVEEGSRQPSCSAACHTGELEELRSSVATIAERMVARANGQSFKIPVILFICAFVSALLALAGWSVALERNKADRAAVVQLEETKADKAYVQEMKGELKEIARDVKTLLQRR